MAVTNNGTKVLIEAAKLPVGYTKPVVTTFTDAEYIGNISLNVLKSSVENADPVLTMQNILSNATVGVNKQITDKVTADFIGTNNTTVFSELLEITNNQQRDDSGFFTNVANSFVCKVRFHVKSAV